MKTKMKRKSVIVYILGLLRSDGLTETHLL